MESGLFARIAVICILSSWFMQVVVLYGPGAIGC